MPVPANLFDSLKLSRDPLFKTGNPELLAGIAKRWLALTEDPEIRAALEEAGIPSSMVSGIVDVPSTTEGIRLVQRQERNQQDRGLFERASEGAARLVDFTGLADPITDLFAGPGAETTALPELPSEQTLNLPFIGPVDPVGSLTQLAGFLAGAAGTVGAASAAIGATGLAATMPKLAIALSGAAGFGGLEAGRQGIRKVTKDEDFNLAQIGIESGIGLAAFAPLKGGFLTRRARAATAATAAATGLPPLLGEEIDPGRAFGEATFGFLLGNPKLANVISGSRLRKVLVALDKPETKKLAAKLPAGISPRFLPRTPQRIKDFLASHKNLKTVSDATKGQEPKTIVQEIENVADDVVVRELKSSERSLPTVRSRRKGPESPIKPQVHDAERVVAKMAESGLTPKQQKKALKTRAKITKEVAEKTSLEVLKSVAKEPSLTEPQRILVRDAIAQKEGRTVTSVDAPTVTEALGTKDGRVQFVKDMDGVISEMAKRKTNPKLFQTERGDPQKLADFVGFKALTRMSDPLRGPEAKEALKPLSEVERLKLEVSLDDAREVVMAERRAAGEKKPNFDDDKTLKAAADMIGLHVDEVDGVVFEPSQRALRAAAAKDPREALRQMVIDDNLLRGNREHIEAEVAKAEGNIELEQTRRAEAAESEAKAQAAADPNADLGVISEAQVRKVVDEFFDTPGKKLTLKQINTIELPTELEPFREIIKAQLRLKAKHRKSAAKAADDTRKLAEDLNAADDIPGTITPINITGGIRGTTGASTKAGKVFSFKEIRPRWHDKTNADLRPEGTGFDLVNSDGQTHHFSTLKAAEEALEKGITVKPVLDAIAGGKLATIEHVGGGRYRTTNKVTGDQVFHEDMASVAELVKNIKDPISVELTSVPGGTVTMGGGGGIGGPSSAGRKPNFEMPGSGQAAFPSFSRVYGTQDEVFKRIQDAIGIPVFDEAWEPLMSHSNLRDTFQSLGNDVLNRKIFKGIKPGRRNIVQDLLIAGNNRTRVARELGASAREVEAAKKLRQWYKDVGGFTTKQVNEFIDEVIPLARMHSGDPMRMRRSDNTFPGSMHEVLDSVIEGRLNLADPNSHVVAQEFLYSLGHQRFMQPAIQRANAVKKTIKKAQRRKGLSTEDSNNLDTTKAALNDFMDSIITGVGGGARGQSTAEFLRPMFEGLKKHGLIKRAAPTAKEVDQWSSEMASYISGAALSMRPALAMRNFFQRGLAANKVGWDTLIEAQRLALTPEGLKLINDGNIIPTRVTWFVEDIARMFKNDKSIRRFVQRAQSAGLGLYRKADHGNRGVSYLAGYLSVKEHAHLLRKGDVDGFLINTGLATESSTVINRVLKPLQNVDPKGWDAVLDRSAKEWGTRITQDTQFIYNPANAPMWMQSLPGRFYGQFGVWPMAFVQHNIRNLSGLGAGGARGTTANKFMIRQFTQLAVLTTVGSTLGIDTSSYNRAVPIIYEGGPVSQAVGDIFAIATGAESEFGTRLALRNLERFAATFWSPFGGSMQDVLQALEEEDPYFAFITLMGVTTKDPLFGGE